MKNAAAMPRSQVQKMLTPGDVFVNTTADGRLMASNRCWIVAAERLTELFDWWNLPVEKGSFYVNGRVSRTVITPPDFDYLLKAPAKWQPVRPVRAGVAPLLFESGKSTCVLFEQGEHRLGLNKQFLDFIAPDWNGGTTLVQATDEPLRPVMVLDGNKPAAVLMPVRLA